MSMQDLLNSEVELDNEVNDESFDEEIREVIARNGHGDGHVDDSSEEEDDDDDEEAVRKVCV